MILECRNLNFFYPQPAGLESDFALRDISLVLRQGEVIGLVGQNGSGKSTLLQLLAGLENPDSGRVIVRNDAGENVLEPRDGKLVGLVFQFPEMQLFENTVEEDVAFGPRQLGLAPEEVFERVNEALLRVGLEPALFRKRPILRLSQGEKRRVAIAGILAMDPPFLLLDEPTAGLDSSGSRTLVGILQELATRHGKGVLIASHDIDFLAEVAQRLLVLENGRLLHDISVSSYVEIATHLPENFPQPRAYRLSQHLRRLGLALPGSSFRSKDLLSFLRKQLLES